MIYENIVIGGGASGLMFCAQLNKTDNTLILEKTDKLGSKILISGGGRCNFTNSNINSRDFLAKKSFIKPIINRFGNKWILRYFKQRNLNITIKNGSEYFCKNSSKELHDILIQNIKGVKINYNQDVISIDKENDLFIILTKSRKYKAKRVVVASGGLSFPILGASDIGFNTAKNFGIDVTTLSPALVGFTLQKEQNFFKELSGISLESKVEVLDYSFKMPLLFTHKGISGPAILNASLFWQKGTVTIDFLPDLKLESLRFSKKTISNALPLPQRFTKSFLKHIGLDNLPINKLDDKQWNLLKKLKKYSFSPAGTFGYKKAEVTKGGVNVDELDNSSFMSKKIKNLYFIGEVVDVTGRLGGYNFTWCFASAKVCAKWINSQ